MHSSLLSALLLTFAATASLAFPNGAPGCVVNEKRISKMGGKNTNLGFSISPSSKSYKPGKPMKFTLEGPSYYKGLLLFVNSASDKKLRVGNFKIPKGFHSNKDKCDEQGFTAGPNGALTQSNSSKKQPGTQFTWTPEKDAACETVEIHAVVAKEQSKWQILPVVKLHCKEDGGQEPYDGDKQPADEYDDEKEPANYDAPADEYDAPAGEYDEHGDKIEYDENGKKKKCKKGKKPAGEYEEGKKEYETPAGEYEEGKKEYETPAGEYEEGKKEYETPAGEYEEGGKKPKKKKKCKKGKKPAGEYEEGKKEYETPAGEYEEGKKEYETPADYTEGDKKPAGDTYGDEKPAEEAPKYTEEYDEHGDKVEYDEYGKKKPCNKGKKPAEEYKEGDKQPAGDYSYGGKEPAKENPYQPY